MERILIGFSSSVGEVLVLPSEAGKAEAGGIPLLLGSTPAQCAGGISLLYIIYTE